MIIKRFILSLSILSAMFGLNSMPALAEDADTSQKASETETAKRAHSYLTEVKADAKAALASLTPFTSDKGISFDYPKSWEVQEYPAGSPVLFKVKTLKGVVNFNVVPDKVPEGMTADAYVKATIEGIPSYIVAQKMPVADIKLVEQKELELGKQNATRLAFTYKFTELDLKVKVIQILAFKKDGTVFIFCFTLPEDTFDDYSDLIQKVTDSIKIS